jgi:hypothetical protein
MDTFTNSGILQKANEGSISSIAVNLLNQGSLFVRGGTLQLLGNENHQSDIANAGVAHTQISNNATLKTRTGYFVSSGTLGGIGVIEGDVSMTVPLGQADAGRPRFLYAGIVGEAAGPLQIRGNLSLNQFTAVIIDMVTTNSYGSIAVLPNEAGVGGRTRIGSATLFVRRTATFTPNNEANFFLMTTMTSTGYFTPARVLGRGWNDANNTPVRLIGWAIREGQPLVFGRTAFGVTVAKIGPAAANANAGNGALLAIFQDDPDFEDPIFVAAVNGNANNVDQPIETGNDNDFEALADGSFDFVADNNFVGEDEVAFSVSDGNTTKSATFTALVSDADITVVEPDFLVGHDAQAEYAGSGFGTSLFDYTSNYDFDNLVVTEVNGNGDNVGEEIATVEGGAVVVNADGTFTYTAPADFIGEDTFNVTVSDGDATETMTITIKSINTYATGASHSTLRNQTLNVDDETGLLTSAGDVDGDPLTVTKVAGEANNVGEEVETAEGGTITVEEDGSFVYDPPTDFYGDDSVTVTVSDGDSESTMTLTLHVVKVLAIDGGTSTHHDTGGEAPGGLWESDLLSLATDAEEHDLTVVAIDGNPDAIGEDVETVMGGTLTVESDGTFVYEPPPHWAGDDWFSFTVSDSNDHESTAWFVIHVTNTPPVVLDAEYSTDMNDTFEAPGIDFASGLLINASDDDDDDLVIYAIQGLHSNVGNQAQTDQGGTVTVEEDGSWVYVPPLNWTGTDTFTFTIWDGCDFITATVTMHVG